MKLVASYDPPSPDPRPALKPRTAAPNSQPPRESWHGNRMLIGKSAESPFGKMWSEVTWGEALEAIARGDRDVKSRIDWMHSLPVKEGQYQKNDIQRRERCRTLLTYWPSEQPSQPEQEEPPF